MTTYNVSAFLLCNASSAEPQLVIISFPCTILSNTVGRTLSNEPSFKTLFRVDVLDKRCYIRSRRVTVCVCDQRITALLVRLRECATLSVGTEQTKLCTCITVTSNCADERQHDTQLDDANKPWEVHNNRHAWSVVFCDVPYLCLTRPHVSLLVDCFR